ncbi:MAG TPA: hypothetical protein VFC31_03915 [Candidatus Limnocylindria bacterium]|nr:hypothetical protein [Candidatus Limnocylindria bacterium]
MSIRHDDPPTDRVERVEHAHDGPAYRATPTATNANAGTGTTAMPVWTVTSVVTLIFTVLEALLLLLTRPFQGIFPEPAGPPVLDVPALLAIVFLVLVGALVVALVRAITAPRGV